MIRLCLFFLLAAVSPASGQDDPAPNLTDAGQGSPGGVARLVFAHQLFSLGRTNKDPLSVLNAARLAASVTLTTALRTPEGLGESIGAATDDTAPKAAARLPTPEDMFDMATTLAAQSDALLDVIDAARRETPYAPTTAAITSTSTLGAARAESWQLPFHGASLAEIAVLGDGGSNLDLRVTDDNGRLVCQDIGPSDRGYCSFYPARNGTFLIAVSNTGASANTYMILTN